MHFWRRADTSDPPDPALPHSFGARYGAGVRRAVSLGGGGTFFLAWQVGYLNTVAHHGIAIERADRLVGTSAGSIVAATLARDRLGTLYSESAVLSRIPGVLARLFPTRVDASSQQKALDLYVGATDSTPETIRSIGHAALAAVTPRAGTMPRNLALVVGERWESDVLWMTCVDTLTGERCVMTHSSGVGLALGAAASSAVPGIFAPQVIVGRKCMDGGVGGTAVHLDLVAGADRALVLSLYRDPELPHAMLTLTPGDLDHELAQLRATGTDVFFRTPEQHPMDVDGLMDPKGVPAAMAMGVRQADADINAGELARFWS